MFRRGVLFFCFVFFLSLFAFSSAYALPKNFRNVDTFYVGAMPSVSDIDEFNLLGIKSILSLHRLPEEVKKRAKRYGMKLYSFPLRTRLLKIEEIMEVLKRSPVIRSTCIASMVPIEQEQLPHIG